MIIIAYLLTGISALLGLATCVLGLMLSWTLFGSFGSTMQKAVAVVIAVVSLLYAAHPMFAVSLIKADKLLLCYLYNAVLIAVSIGSCFLLSTSIGAAAQP